MSSGIVSPKGDIAAQQALPPGATGTAVPSKDRRIPFVVLTGNPNCGKTTLFNALTGLRAKVGNYAGVTVERKEGPLLGSAVTGARVLDLPGTYSLSPQSLDEQIARDVLLNRVPEIPPPACVVVVVDASNLQRNLYYATQVIELGYPVVIALNMIDVARQNGHDLDVEKLSTLLGVPALATVASTGQGVKELRQHLDRLLAEPPSPTPGNFCVLPAVFQHEVRQLADTILGAPASGPTAAGNSTARARAEALLLISNEKALSSSTEHYPVEMQRAVLDSRKRLESEGIDWAGAPIEARYQSIGEIQQQVAQETAIPGETLSDKLDRVLTHRVWGTVAFLGLMALMFQSIFTFARIPMDALQVGVGWLGRTVGNLIPPGDLNSLLVEGVIAGVGAVVIFLPQILLLFLFIGFLEDTGYMARAAFLMDRIMSKVGLHGKSFIPMLSSFACAIPGIMATRTIESPKDRMVTILISPLMSCSARLPVYTLLIAACIPEIRVFGVLKLSGLVMLGMYVLGASVALAMAWLFKKTLLKGEPPLLILELPPYKRPLVGVVLRHMWERSRMFLRQAGTIILGINIILWFLATYPRDSRLQADFAAQRAAVAASVPAGLEPAASRQFVDQKVAQLQNEEAGSRLRQSFAGRLGHLIEPIISPLGFDWKIGIGIISSFAAREVFVSTMSTVYNVGDSSTHGSSDLAKTLRAQMRPDGSAFYSPLGGVTLMVFYVFALQCVSTVAVVHRETNSWRWPLFQWFYMGTLAWVFAFTVRHVGLALGFS